MKITLCGSTRYREEYELMNRELSKRGHVVYSVSAFGHSGDPLTDDEKEVQDLVHLWKISESDCVLVVGTGPDERPYVGDSTRREIRWAKMLGKDVWFTAFKHHQLNQFQSVDDLYPGLPKEVWR